MQRLKMKQTEEADEFEANVMSQFVHKYKWSADVSRLGHWEQKFFKSHEYKKAEEVRVIKMKKQQHEANIIEEKTKERAMVEQKKFKQK